MKGRLASDNIRRLLNIIDESSRSRSLIGLFFMDAQNAFDRVEVRLLWKVLEKFNFGPKLIKMIKILYTKPSASVCIGGIPSSTFSIFHGTRQGCPLSPLLYPFYRTLSTVNMPKQHLYPCFYRVYKTPYFIICRRCLSIHVRYPVELNQTIEHNRYFW